MTPSGLLLSRGAKPGSSLIDKSVGFLQPCHFGPFPIRTDSLLLIAATVFATRAFAVTVSPIAVSGYNQDVIVEAGAPANAAGVTTATMDGGSANNNGTWYEQGYNGAAPANGLPTHGSTITSASASDHTYQFASSYGPGNGAAGTTNDAFVVGQGTGSPTITLAVQAAYSTISLVGSSGNGPNPVSFTIRFTDATTQTGTLSVLDWFNGAPAAYIANGRVTVGSGSFNTVNGNNPRIFDFDITVNSTVPISSIALSSAAAKTAAFFAVSGAQIAPEPSSLALILLAGCGGLGLIAVQRRRTVRS